MKLKSIANYISITRMLLVILLTFVKPLSTAFLAIYIACGITDVSDGYIARKTGTESELGEKLDTIGDFIMVSVVIFKLYSIINLELKFIVWIIVIALIKALSIIVVSIKFRTFEILHTYASKFAGLLIFVSVISLKFFQANIMFYMICAVATIAAIEELIIHITSKELQSDRKSIFLK